MIRVAFTGDIFAIQKYGGISRYFVELGKAMLSQQLAIPEFRSLLYINAYLYENRRDLSHTGIYFYKHFPGLQYISRSMESTRNLLSKKFDVAHETYYDAFDLMKVKSRARFSTFYDMIQEKNLGESKLTNAKRQVFDLSNHCIAISESTKRDMIDVLNVTSEKISVVYLAANAYPPMLSYRLRENLKNASEKYILWVGPRGGYKNFQATAVAFSSSRFKQEGIKFVCAGGSRLSVVEKEFWHSLGLSSSSIVQLTPNDFELAWLYQNAICLVYASCYEGFGIPPLEAMQNNCPVIASNCSSIPEVVGEAALKIDPRSVDSIADALNAIFDSNSLREKLGKLGVAQASLFSWERCARETSSLYERFA